MVGRTYRGRWLASHGAQPARTFRHHATGWVWNIRSGLETSVNATSAPLASGQPNLIVDQPLGDPRYDRVRQQHTAVPLIRQTEAQLVTGKQVGRL